VITTTSNINQKITLFSVIDQE